MKKSNNSKILFRTMSALALASSIACSKPSSESSESSPANGSTARSSALKIDGNNVAAIKGFGYVTSNVLVAAIGDVGAYSCKQFLADPTTFPKSKVVTLMIPDKVADYGVVPPEQMVQMGVTAVFNASPVQATPAINLKINVLEVKAQAAKVAIEASSYDKKSSLSGTFDIEICN